MVSWVVTLVIARVLTPADFGILALAQLPVELLGLISEFGVGTAVVTLRELSAAQLAQLNTVCLVLGLLGLLVASALAWPLAGFFAAPELPAVLLVVAASLVVASLRVVPSASLQRELRFRLLAGIDLAAGLLVPLVTLLLALLGFGYWALVLGGFASVVVTTAATVIARPHGFGWPRLGALGPVIGFSWRILVSRVAWFTYSNADFAVAGRVLGQAPLGAYTIAWTLANGPLEKVTALVTGVTPGFFSAVQSDLVELRRYFLSLTEALALIALPLTVGVALVADDFVDLALGPRWQAVALPLRLLALYASYRSVTAVLPYVLTALREMRLGMWNAVFSLALLPPAFYVGSAWGVAGIAGAWLVCYPLLVVAVYARIFRRLELSPRRYLAVLWPALNATAAMAAVVLVAQRVLPISWPLAVRFALEVAGGGVVYAAVTLSLYRARVRAIVARLRSVPGRS
jgi:O-antigen/teichoic acid export membrane protein